MIIDVPRNTGILFIYSGELNWFSPPDVPETVSKGEPEMSNQAEESPEITANELDTIEITSVTEGDPVVPEVVAIEVAKPQGPGV